MSGSLRAWYSLRDLEELGGRQAKLEGELEVADLPRLAALLHSTAGSVRASLHFRQRGAGPVAATLALDATVDLVCQRCLEPFAQSIVERIELMLIEPGATAASMPDGYEPIELDDGRLLPARLIEDELIVSIPFVPKHARIEDCGSLARQLTS
jgi:uncharacterized protein